MTGLKERLAKFFVPLILTILAITTIALARQERRHEPLGFLKHMLTEAGASALTSDQETQLTALIKNFHSAQSDDTVKAARTAYTDAILSGDLDTAQAQAAIISSRMTELTKTRLQAVAKFQIDALTILKSGGQLDALKQKLGSERLVGLLGQLAGGPPFGPGFGPGGRGFGPGGPGFGPPPPPEKSGKE